MGEKGIHYMGMGVSGGEEGARHGPSMMPGGPEEAYKVVEPILTKVAAQVDDGPCVTWIGPRGAGNYVKMIHNGIEYGDMQLIAETYDILKNIGGLNNEELAATFKQYNEGELQSFLIEITAQIFTKKEDGVYVVDVIKDKTGSKGTGKWTVQEAAENGVPTPTITTALDARYISSLLDQRVKAKQVLHGPPIGKCPVPREQLVKEVSHALYASKICSYTQGMNLIKTAGESHKWGLKLGAISRIWKGGCIIRARFLDRIKAAYDKDSQLVSLLMDPDFARVRTHMHTYTHIPHSSAMPAQPVLGHSLLSAACIPCVCVPPLVGDERSPGQSALCSQVRYRRRHQHASIQRITRLLRRIQTRPPASQPHSGAERLLRSAHLREDRQGGNLPHRVGQAVSTADEAQ